MTIWNQLAPLVFKATVGFVITGLLGVIMWPIRKVRKEWSGLTSKLDAVHTELVTQRQNCLGTLQEQGKIKIELLGKTVAALDGVRLDLAEQTGYLRASACLVPVARRRVAKK